MPDRNNRRKANPSFCNVDGGDTPYFDEVTGIDIDRFDSGRAGSAGGGFFPSGETTAPPFMRI